MLHPTSPTYVSTSALLIPLPSNPYVLIFESCTLHFLPPAPLFEGKGVVMYQLIGEKRRSKCNRTTVLQIFCVHDFGTGGNST